MSEDTYYHIFVEARQTAVGDSGHEIHTCFTVLYFEQRVERDIG